MNEKRVINNRKTKDDIEITETEEVKTDGTKSQSATVRVLGGLSSKTDVNLKNK